VAEDLVGGLGQDEGLAAFGPAVDEGAGGRDDVFDRGDGAAPDRLSGDDPRDFDLVKPAARGEGEAQLDAWMLGQERVPVSTAAAAAALR